MSSIKPVFKCPEEFKNIFSQSRCLLTISVGQEAHEGEKFATTVDLVNRSFGECTMLIDDSLQRHTMALNTEKNAEDFYDISMLEGDAWLNRNSRIYNRITIPLNIIRWNQWLFHENFQSQQKKIIELISQDLEYSNAFLETVQEFLRRYCNRTEPSQVDQLCMNYLLEECTAMSLWPELNCHFEVYPSKRNFAMAATHQRFVLPDYPDLLHSIAIKFKNRKQLKPQCFEALAYAG